MSDYEDDIDTDFDDNEDEEVEEVEEEVEDEEKESDNEDNDEYISLNTKQKNTNNGFYTFNCKELENIKISQLKKPKKFEIFKVLEVLIDMFKSGSHTLVDEKEIGIQLYDNFNVVNEETMACISLKERKTGLCVLKEGHLLNVDNYDIKYIDYYLKKNILRLHDQNNKIVRIDTLKEIYKNLEIYKDDITSFYVNT